MAKGSIALNSGGIKRTLLWANSSPTTAFFAHTFSFDVSNYDYIEIHSYGHVSAGIRQENTNIILTSVSLWQSVCAPYMPLNKTDQKDSVRNYKIINGVLECGIGYFGNDDNPNYCPPVYIYGLKGKVLGGVVERLLSVFHNLFNRFSCEVSL